MNALSQLRAIGRFLGAGMDGKPDMIDAPGNPGSHLILRGGKTGTNFDAESIATAHAVLKGNSRIVVDCSHGNSSKKHKNQPIVAADVGRQIREGNQSIMGECLLLERRVP